MTLDELLAAVTPDPDTTITDLTLGPSVLTGTSATDWILAGDGADTVEAADGDDVVSKSLGSGMVYGGAGRDTLSLRDVLSDPDRDWIYDVDLRSGEASLRRAPDGSFEISLDSIENVAGSLLVDRLDGDGGGNVLAGYAQDDWLYGHAGDDTLWDGNGVDDLEGGDGDDYLHGGRGFLDFLDGGAGNDTINGGRGHDIAQYWDAEQIAVERAPDADDEFIVTHGEWEDRLIGIEEIWGSDGNDIYRTGAGATAIDAEAGDDRIFAGSGSDDLYGGAGNDTMFGGAGRDWLSGDAGKDHMWGDAAAPTAADHFLFEPSDTGASFRGRADVIHDFDARDTIVIVSNSDLASSDDGRSLERETYTVFGKNDAFTVRWREASGPVNDIRVKGDNPTGHIDLVMFDEDGGWIYAY